MSYDLTKYFTVELESPTATALTQVRSYSVTTDGELDNSTNIVVSHKKADPITASWAGERHLDEAIKTPILDSLMSHVTNGIWHGMLGTGGDYSAPSMANIASDPNVISRGTLMEAVGDTGSDMEQKVIVANTGIDIPEADKQHLAVMSSAGATVLYDDFFDTDHTTKFVVWDKRAVLLRTPDSTIVTTHETDNVRNNSKQLVAESYAIGHILDTTRVKIVKGA